MKTIDVYEFEIIIAIISLRYDDFEESSNGVF